MLRMGFVVLLLLLLTSLQPVLADGARGIVFLGGGQTTADQDEFNGTATAFKLGSGYQATENSSIEIYWVSYGEAEEEVVGADFKAEAYSVVLQYGYHYPLAANFDLLAKIGLALWKTNYGFVGFEKEQDDGTDPVIAVGAEMGMGEDWGVRVEWEYAQFDDTDVTLVSASILSYFD